MTPGAPLDALSDNLRLVASAFLQHIPTTKLDSKMAQTGLGVALRRLRERRTLSLREMSQLSSVDHAYVHRLETGEKASPSLELVGKLLKVLKAGERDTELVKWLVGHPEADPVLVEFVLGDPSISVDIFAAAAGVRHRGTARPDPATLIARIKRAFEDDE
jgi:HTH-type transcriptional regulator, competence development regulator